MVRDAGDRPVEFDAWVASRSAALARFGFLVTGSEKTAEPAIGAALAKACRGWARLRRTDDPEAEVKRLIVQAHLARMRSRERRRHTAGIADPAAATTGIGPPGGSTTDAADTAWRFCAALPASQRAALVLRCHAELTYPQIAAVVGCRVATAVHQVETALAGLGRMVRPARDVERTEALLRETFADRAENVADLPDRAARARGSATAQRRRGLMAAAACALAVLAIGTALAVVERPSATSPSRPTVPPRGWRAEAYDGVELWVPSAWGWGVTPTRSASGLRTCGVGAYSPTTPTASLHWIPNGYPVPPYVGRPVAGSTQCRPTPRMTPAHVWFDSPLPVGRTAAATTVRAAGVVPVVITVADRDLAERNAILATIRAARVDANGCPRDSAGVERLQALAQPAPRPGFVRSLSLCLFTSGPSRRQVLYYSTRIDGPAAHLAMARIDAKPAHESTDDVCLVAPAVDQVVLIARTPTMPSVFGVNPGTCRQHRVGYVTGAGFHALTPRSAQVWAVDGFSLYAGGTLRAGPTRLLPYLPHS